MSGLRGKPRRFVVDLGDLDIDDKVASDIGDGIQRVVLDVLSRYRSDSGRNYGIRFPREWIGLIIRERLETLDALAEVEKEVIGFAGMR
ncbi:hypothetical protein GXW74_12120 [Roseomonas eburnea]|uniref:Uncharacterized protein n=1 Tax=Neoroseomonas eburnea TaxID=1346889 RepID=A0A9X9XBZ6_9PROT|nr:hypothetical protein [Neoroseomonas eburnea]MBR0681232.1 hypothetical protein [Neoroseomonas eburnea]